MDPLYEDIVRKGGCPPISEVLFDILIESDICGDEFFSFKAKVESPLATDLNFIFDKSKFLTDNQSDEEFKLPKVSFESISNSGLVVFSFSEKFVSLDDLSRLKRQEIFYKGEKKDNIELFVDTVDDQTTE